LKQKREKQITTKKENLTVPEKRKALWNPTAGITNKLLNRKSLQGISRAIKSL